MSSLLPSSTSLEFKRSQGSAITAHSQAISGFRYAKLAAWIDNVDLQSRREATANVVTARAGASVCQHISAQIHSQRPSRTFSRCLGWNFTLHLEMQNWRRREGWLPWFGSTPSCPLKRGFFDSREVLMGFRKWLLTLLVTPKKKRLPARRQSESGLDLHPGSRVRCWASSLCTPPLLLSSKNKCDKCTALYRFMWLACCFSRWKMLQVWGCWPNSENIQQLSLNYVHYLSTLNIHRGGIHFDENEDLKNIDSSEIDRQCNPPNLLPSAYCQSLI